MLTRDDIEAEHLAALKSLTFEQRRALHRTREALRIGNFNHHSLREVLHQLFEREGMDGAGVNIDDVEREHLAATASLTPMQRQALHRVDRALQIANFSHHSIKEVLLELFEKEAVERNSTP